jgi:hypothetical protein
VSGSASCGPRRRTAAYTLIVRGDPQTAPSIARRPARQLTGCKSSSPSVARNDFSGERGRDGFQIDAVLFDDAAQFDYGLQIEVDRAGRVLTSLQFGPSSRPS